MCPKLHLRAVGAAAQQTGGIYSEKSWHTIC